VRGAAAAAGLLPDDIITHIDEQRVVTWRDAISMIAGEQPGDVVRIRVLRSGGEVFETEAVLEERPSPPGS
jgi:S1-C subfamily serine protease